MGLKGDNELVSAMEEAPTYVTSIAVPSVHELVKKDPSQVPEKYVRSHKEMEKDNYMPHLSSEVPIIDFALLSNGNKEELSKLDIACKEWGFFQINITSCMRQMPICPGVNTARAYISSAISSYH
ncbi:hypothetical protein RIF29_30231 [Crotalaria pallida]|uniref:Non-haem dioxygenase N-terminal domain-containing protein n=1 Tax=Crotalaria pallida TaxID=3830 RepID=A0AAN9HY53_CROPI